MESKRCHPAARLHAATRPWRVTCGALATLLTALWFLAPLPAATEELPMASPPRVTDPNHEDSGGFGYLVDTTDVASVWWAEGCYKVMRDAPLPTREAPEVELAAAGREAESFILVVNPTQRLEDVRVSLPELRRAPGQAIEAGNITIRKVEYVKVTRPTDSYGYSGRWPDPLPLHTGPETLYANENQPFWVTVHVPAEAAAGRYVGQVQISAGAWVCRVPVTLEVWPFCLPRTPALRSGLGLDMGSVYDYEHLREPAQQRQVFEYYMQAYRDYRISPYDPFLHAPIREEITGIAWQGGFYDREVVHGGTYSYRVVDDSRTQSLGAVARELIPVNATDAYRLSWFARAATAGQSYVVGLECFDAGRERMVFHNRFEAFTASQEWQPGTLELEALDPAVRFVRVRLYPATPTRSGEEVGTVWFDDVALMNTATGLNEFAAGDFEVDLDAIDIHLDFTDFNAAGRRYFDEYGFTGWRLNLKGLGGGTYYSRVMGNFEGFAQGTAEYDKLMARYLGQMQANLEANGWLGREYIYWFDEPGEADYPFVRETHALIKRHAPKLTTFLTEHVSGQDISDVTDISCTIWHRLDHAKRERMQARGQQCWSYLCCWPKSPWISEFIDHDAINLRLWSWASWQYRLQGLLMWATTYWNSDAASPPGYLQNPWEEAMSFVSGYGWPLGKQTIWGNGDGRLFYPNNRDPNHDLTPHVEPPVPSLRLEILRDGIEDYDYFVLLEQAIRQAPAERQGLAREAASLLVLPSRLYTDEQTYAKDPQELLRYRRQVASYIVRLTH